MIIVFYLEALLSKSSFSWKNKTIVNYPNIITIVIIITHLFIDTKFKLSPIKTSIYNNLFLCRANWGQIYIIPPIETTNTLNLVTIIKKSDDANKRNCQNINSNTVIHVDHQKILLQRVPISYTYLLRSLQRWFMRFWFENFEWIYLFYFIWYHIPNFWSHKRKTFGANAVHLTLIKSIVILHSARFCRFKNMKHCRIDIIVYLKSLKSYQHLWASVIYWNSIIFLQ